MMLNKPNKIKKIFGFTLVEVMVALAISSILMLGVIQLFSSSKRSSKVNEALARVQENARFAMDSLITDLRRAGYVGCSPNINSFVDDSSDPDLYSLNNATGGWEYVKTNTFPGGSAYTITKPVVTSATAADWNSQSNGSLPAGLVGRVVEGTDVIVMKWVEPISGLNGKTINNFNSTSLQTTSPHGFSQGSIVIVGDCTVSDAFMAVPNAPSALTRGAATGNPPGNINVSSKWSKEWQSNSQFMAGFNRVYFIGIGAGGGPALYTASYQNGTSAISYQELAEGIENMQVLYGADTSGDGILDTYETAQNVSHSQVVSVQVGLVARSEDEPRSAASTRALDVIGININTPNDRRLRYVFTGTVKLRNKGIR